MEAGLFKLHQGLPAFRIYASTHWRTHQRYIAQAAPWYDALPDGWIAAN